MRFLSKEHVYHHDWETVTSAWWTKFPNAAQPHVKALDTVSRDIDAEAQTLKVRRVFELDWAIPWYVQKVLMRPSVKGFAVEDIDVDLKARKLSVVGRNHSLSRVIGFEETCSYEQHPTNPGWTVFKQNTVFRSSLADRFGDWVTRGIERVQGNASNAGIGVMEGKIKRLLEEDWRAKAYLWEWELKALLARGAARLQERAVLCAEKDR